mgnify:CR=1 FL=1
MDWRDGRYWYACSIAVIEFTKVDLSSILRILSTVSRIWSASGSGTAGFVVDGLPRGCLGGGWGGVPVDFSNCFLISACVLSARLASRYCCPSSLAFFSLESLVCLSAVVKKSSGWRRSRVVSLICQHANFCFYAKSTVRGLWPRWSKYCLNDIILYSDNIMFSNIVLSFINAIERFPS